MKRREFIALVGGAALAWPLPLRAQQRDAVRRIGVLIAASRPHPFENDLRQALRDQGLSDGQNIAIAVRYSDGRNDRAQALAVELVGLGMDVIVGHLTPAVRAAKEATSTIPIVMAPAGNPVETRLVKSLARPGGNITGIATFGAEVAGKRLELLREVMPNLARVAALASTNDPFAKPFLQELQSVAVRTGFKLEPVMIGDVADLEKVFATITSMQAEAIIAQPLLENRRDIIELAAKHRLPVVSAYRRTAAAGALISYATDQSEQVQMVAAFVAKILKGAKPVDLPVEQSTKFELVVNLKTARALGLTIPQSILLRANEVIE